ncbi:uncharacterized protein METZ01_LOCUS230646 [marine metagenome]|uniref:Uncharacterized protein n=1 Tax=marine metagenome TaxID=408172 RepID=A0A382GSD9_9ZZZZ
MRFFIRYPVLARLVFKFGMTYMRIKKALTTWRLRI